MSRANATIIQTLSNRNRCWQCRHRFSESVLLPVKKPERGKFQPNISTEVLFHMQDTHGIHHQIVREWIIGAVYGWDINEVGIKGWKHD